MSRCLDVKLNDDPYIHSEIIQIIFCRHFIREGMESIYIAS